MRWQDKAALFPGFAAPDSENVAFTAKKHGLTEEQVIDRLLAKDANVLHTAEKRGLTPQDVIARVVAKAQPAPQGGGKLYSQPYGGDESGLAYVTKYVPGRGGMIPAGSQVWREAPMSEGALDRPATEEEIAGVPRTIGDTESRSLAQKMTATQAEARAYERLPKLIARAAQLERERADVERTQPEPPSPDIAPSIESGVRSPAQAARSAALGERLQATQAAINEYYQTLKARGKRGVVDEKAKDPMAKIWAAAEPWLKQLGITSEDARRMVDRFVAGAEAQTGVEVKPSAFMPFVPEQVRVTSPEQAGKYFAPPLTGIAGALTGVPGGAIIGQQLGRAATELPAARIRKQITDKIAKGDIESLTEDERELADAMATRAMVEQGIPEKIGAGAAALIPYMVSTAIGVKASGGALGKLGLADVSKLGITDRLRRAATIGGISTLADPVQSIVGATERGTAELSALYSPEVDEVLPKVEKAGDPQAALKAILSTFGTYTTEQAGAVIDDVASAMSRIAGKTISKSKALDTVRRAVIARAVGKYGLSNLLAGKASISSFGAEFGEELADMYYQAGIVDNERPPDIGSPEFNDFFVTTLAVLAVPGAAHRVGAMRDRAEIAKTDRAAKAIVENYRKDPEAVGPSIAQALASNLPEDAKLAYQAAAAQIQAEKEAEARKRPAEPPTSPVVERPAGDRVEQPAAPESPVAGRIATPDVASAEDARREERLRRKFQTPPVTGEGLAAGPGVTVQTEVQAPEAEQPKPKTTAEAIRRSLDESLAARRITEQQYADALRAAGIGVQPEAKPFDTPVAQSDRVMQVVASLYDKGNTTPTLSDIMREMGLAAVGPQRESVRQALAQAAENGWVEYHRPVGTQLEVSVTPITNRPKAKLSVGEGAEAALPAEEVEPSEYAPQAPAAAPGERGAVELRAGGGQFAFLTDNPVGSRILQEVLNDKPELKLLYDELLRKGGVAIDETRTASNRRKLAEGVRGSQLWGKGNEGYRAAEDKLAELGLARIRSQLRDERIDSAVALQVADAYAKARFDREKNAIAGASYAPLPNELEGNTGAAVSSGGDVLVGLWADAKHIHHEILHRRYSASQDRATLRDEALRVGKIIADSGFPAATELAQMVDRVAQESGGVLSEQQYAEIYASALANAAPETEHRPMAIIAHLANVRGSSALADLFANEAWAWRGTYSVPHAKRVHGDRSQGISLFAGLDPTATVREFGEWLKGATDSEKVAEAERQYGAVKVEKDEAGETELLPAVRIGNEYSGEETLIGKRGRAHFQVLQDHGFKLPFTDVGGGYVFGWVDRDGKWMGELPQAAESIGRWQPDNFPTNHGITYDQWVANGRLLAPNGKPSKLNERQYRQVRTPFFKRWFGDFENDPANASKVVDPETGEPMVVYHGTSKNFTEFKRGDIGIHLGTAEQAATRTEHRRIAEGQNIIPVFAAIRNPLRLSDAGDWTRPWNVAYALVDAGLVTEDEVKFAMGRNLATTIDKTGADPKAIMDRALVTLRNKIQQLGYDGVVYSNIAEGKGDSYIAFSPAQIKSAIANRGTYSPETGNILHSGVNFLEAYRAILGELGEATDGTLADLRTRTRGVYDLPHLAGVPDEQFDEWAQAFAERHGLVEPTLESEPEDAEGEKPTREPKPVFGAGWGDRKKAAPGNIVRFTDGSREGEWQVAERKGGTVLLTPYTKDRFRGKEKAVTRVKAKLAQLAVVKTNPEAKDRRLDKLAELGIVPPTTKGEWRSLAARLKQKKDDGGITRGEFSELVHATVGWDALPAGDFVSTKLEKFTVKYAEKISELAQNGVDAIEQAATARAGAKEVPDLSESKQAKGGLLEFAADRSIWRLVNALEDMFGANTGFANFLVDILRDGANQVTGAYTGSGGRTQHYQLLMQKDLAYKKALVDAGLATEKEAAQEILPLKVRLAINEANNRTIGVALTDAKTPAGKSVKMKVFPAWSLGWLYMQMQDEQTGPEMREKAAKGKLPIQIDGQRSEIVVSERDLDAILAATPKEQRILADAAVATGRDIFANPMVTTGREQGDSWVRSVNPESPHAPRARSYDATEEKLDDYNPIRGELRRLSAASLTQLQSRTENERPYLLMHPNYIWHGTFEAAARYAGHRIPGTFVRAILNDPKVIAAGKTRLKNYELLRAEIDKQLDDYELPNRHQTDETSRFWRKLISRLIVGKLGLNPITNAIQTLSGASALATMPFEVWPYWAKALDPTVRKREGLIPFAEYVDKEPFFYHRYNMLKPFEFGVQAQVEGGPPATSKAKTMYQYQAEKSTEGLRTADRKTVAFLKDAYELYHKAKAKKNGETLNKTQIMSRVARDLERQVGDSQASKDELDRTSVTISAEKSDFAYGIQMFMTEQMKAAGNIKRIWAAYREGPHTVKRLANAILRTSIILLVNGLGVTALRYGLRIGMNLIGAVLASILAGNPEEIMPNIGRVLKYEFGTKKPAAWWVTESIQSALGSVLPVPMAVGSVGIEGAKAIANAALIKDKKTGKHNFRTQIRRSGNLADNWIVSVAESAAKGVELFTSKPPPNASQKRQDAWRLRAIDWTLRTFGDVGSGLGVATSAPAIIARELLLEPRIGIMQMKDEERSAETHRELGVSEEQLKAMLQEFGAELEQEQEPDEGLGDQGF